VDHWQATRIWALKIRFLFSEILSSSKTK